MGTHIFKCPLDLWIYQEIIFNLKPDIIIESGTADGGGAFFLASICDMLDNGKVITIDIEEKENRPQHKRINYLLGSSISEEITAQIKEEISGSNTIMVILDSDHHKEHVLEDLRIYSHSVTKNSYIIVEDTNINGHPVFPGFGPGPMEAVEEFLNENKDFKVDEIKEQFSLTFNPRGYIDDIGGGIVWGESLGLFDQFTIGFHNLTTYLGYGWYLTLIGAVMGVIASRILQQDVA